MSTNLVLIVKWSMQTQKKTVYWKNNRALIMLKLCNKTKKIHILYLNLKETHLSVNLFYPELLKAA